jgi:tetratricopeptide (TPR) repeat protein
VLDCELAAAPNTVDANLWARLKLKYELYCYKQVEILIHRRLRQLAAVERLPTVDGTSNNSRGRNLSTLKLLATIIDAPAASSGVVAGEEDAAPGPSIVAPTATTNIAETIPSDGSASSPSKDAKFYLERGIASYRDGDLPVAIADFDLAIEGDPNLKDAYIDQGIAWYRMSNFHRAFDVIAQAARIESSHRACDFTAPEGVVLSNKN